MQIFLHMIWVEVLGKVLLPSRIASIESPLQRREASLSLLLAVIARRFS